MLQESMVKIYTSQPAADQPAVSDFEALSNMNAGQMDTCIHVSLKTRGSAPTPSLVWSYDLCSSSPSEIPPQTPIGIGACESRGLS